MRGGFKGSLAALAQEIETGPVRVAVEEGKNLLRGAAPGAQAIPFDQRDGGRTVPRGQFGGAVPIAALRGVQGTGKRARRAVGRGHGRSDQPGKAENQRNQPQHPLHFLA